MTSQSQHRPSTGRRYPIVPKKVKNALIGASVLVIGAVAGLAANWIVSAKPAPPVSELDRAGAEVIKAILEREKRQIEQGYPKPP